MLWATSTAGLPARDGRRKRRTDLVDSEPPVVGEESRIESLDGEPQLQSCVGGQKHAPRADRAARRQDQILEPPAGDRHGIDPEQPSAPALRRGHLAQARAHHAGNQQHARPARGLYLAGGCGREPTAPRGGLFRKTRASSRRAAAAREPRILRSWWRETPSPRHRHTSRAQGAAAWSSWIEPLVEAAQLFAAIAPPTMSHTASMAAPRVVDLRHTAPTVRAGAGLAN